MQNVKLLKMMLYIIG